MTLPQGFILDQPQEQAQQQPGQGASQELPPGFVLNPSEQMSQTTPQAETAESDDRNIVDKAVDKGQRLVTQGLIGGIQGLHYHMILQL